jgi:hypothetical protein
MRFAAFGSEGIPLTAPRYGCEMMNSAPSTNGQNGRDAGGRFTRGNAGGPGNPHARRVARLRSVMLKSVDGAAIQRIMAALIRRAEDGDVPAAALILNYTVGKPDVVQGTLARVRTSFTFTLPGTGASELGRRLIESVSAPVLPAGQVPDAASFAHDEECVR